MFNGDVSVSFRTSKVDEVSRTVEECLEILGNVAISDSGGITITGSRFDGFGYSTEIVGRLRERDGTVTISLDIQAKPEIVAWAIGVCLFPLGCAIFILPANAKSEIVRKAHQALGEMKSILRD